MLAAPSTVRLRIVTSLAESIVMREVLPFESGVHVPVPFSMTVLPLPTSVRDLVMCRFSSMAYESAVRRIIAPSSAVSTASNNSSTVATEMPVSSTVTRQVAFTPPAVAVMLAVPTETAVTVPPSTVATEGALDAQLTSLSVALSGVTVAVSSNVPPTSSVAEFRLSSTPVTATVVSPPSSPPVVSDSHATTVNPSARTSTSPTRAESHFLFFISYNSFQIFPLYERILPLRNNAQRLRKNHAAPCAIRGLNLAYYIVFAPSCQ